MSTTPPLEADRLRAALAGHDGGTDDALASLAAQPAEASARVLDAELASALVATLDRERRSEQRHAADVLAPIAGCSPALRDALGRALAAPRQRLRWGAAYTLGRAALAGPEAWPAAREAMALDDGDQRWAAAELACAIARRHPAVEDALRSAAHAGPATLRKMALYCLRDLGSSAGRAVARAALGDGDPGVRLAAVSTVCRAEAGSDEAALGAAALAAMVAEDPDPGVRRAAAAALGRLAVRSAAVLRRLEEAARDPDASLARAARGALAALSGSG